MLNNPSAAQRRHSMEAVGRVFNNWSVIQTATLKLVTTFSCHGEYQTGLCLCVREKHKSHSPAIKATRLETRECAECIFSISISPLFSAHFVVMSFLTPLIPVAPYYLSKGKKWTLLNAILTSACNCVFLCHSVLFSSLLCLSFPLPQWHLLILIFLPYFLHLLLSSLYLFFIYIFFFTSLPPSFPLRLRVAWRCPWWRHHPTVNEWVCHTANNLHSSCLICPGLHGSSHDTRAKRMCLGPWHAGSRSTAQGNSTRAQGLFGELVLDLSIRPWRRGADGLPYPWSRITFFFLFVQWMVCWPCMLFSRNTRLQIHAAAAHILTSGRIIG